MTAVARRTSGARVVVLTGGRPWHSNTVATLLQSGANVIGICICEDKVFGLPIPYIRRSARRRGLITVVDQIAGRLLYKLINGRTDARRLNQIFQQEWSRKIILEADIPTHRTNRYGSPTTLSWLRELRPDVLLVHSSQWVPKEVRDTAKSGIVIGGHPGLTPHYRGAHSAFWALYHQRPADLGYSVFHVDGGVDTGDLIAQGRLPAPPDQSYFSLGWLAMREIARVQAEIIRALDGGEALSRKPHATIPQATEYPVPGLSHYLRYLRRQNVAR